MLPKTLRAIASAAISTIIAIRNKEQTSSDPFSI